MLEKFGFLKEKKNLKILFIGALAIAVGLSLFYLSPRKTGGFLAIEGKVQLVGFELDKNEILEGESTKLRILVRNNDEVPHHISIRLIHNERIKTWIPGSAAPEGALLDFGELPPGREVGQSIEVSGTLDELVSSAEYILKVTIFSDAKELISKEIKVKVKRE